jgi:hypothetical protein
MSSNSGFYCVMTEAGGRIAGNNDLADVSELAASRLTWMTSVLPSGLHPRHIHVERQPSKTMLIGRTL